MSLKFKNIETYNWMGAMRGMRNPLNSHNKQDSYYNEDNEFILGDSDYKLAYNLSKAGSDHGKYLRQISVSFDLVAPWLYWKQYATYKVATVENSTSMMHTLTNNKLNEDNFCWDKVTPFREKFLEHINGLIDTIKEIEKNIKDIPKKGDWQQRKKVVELQEKKKEKWRELNEDMSGAYLYKRTCTTNYQVIKNQYHSRVKTPHKLKEWSKDFKEFVNSLPYNSIIKLK